MPESDEEFIPPDPGEPIPQPPPEGATDADLGGVDVTHEYFDDDGRALTVFAAGVGTWAAVYAKARSYLGSRPPGWLRENVNDFTRRFYGNNTKAAWCLIFVWCILNDFFKTAWKLAYVPWLDRIDGEHDGHSGIKVGAICAIARFSHVGFFVADHGSEFDLLSGNSTSGSSSDAITVKRYPKSIIAGYVNVAYAPADPNAYPGTVYRYVKSKLMTGSHVKWIQERLGSHGHTVTVDGEYGPKTAAAVKAFQKDTHLTQDGQVGPKTWAKLAA
jgi:hypothetical protein